MTESRLVLSTVGKQEDAERIARTLVERRLAACVQIAPAGLSFYRWQGAVQREEERLLLIKTHQLRMDDLWEELRRLHPYEVPEILVIPVEAMDDAYRRWLEEAVGVNGPLS